MKTYASRTQICGQCQLEIGKGPLTSQQVAFCQCRDVKWHYKELKANFGVRAAQWLA